ncbi:MAG TPA: uroporphyrin-III C-methyltransferase, partial [Aquifex aeolicus]|nr:uroporphyrin-III C-methyltransferase [Aquifex aeolicus]
MGKVYIVGAGPGDPELLTLKAYRILKEADVILYDRLINDEILNLRKTDCKLVYVGKEDGKHTIPQEEINKLLLFYAKIHKTVVRLKGGDPFIFGRGGEEALFLEQSG